MFALVCAIGIRDVADLCAALRSGGDTEGMRSVARLIAAGIVGLGTFGMLALLLRASPPGAAGGFALCLAVIGPLYLFAITPYSVPDEKFHYISALRESHFFEESPTCGGDYLFLDGAVEHLNHPVSYANLARYFRNPPPEGWRTPLPERPANRLRHLPQCVGILVGRAFDANELQLFYLGRLFALAFYAAVMLAAIRLTPDFRMPLAVIALLPVALQQAASHSYDVMAVSVALLLFALLRRALSGEGTVPWREWLALCACVWIGTAVKWVSVPYLPLLFAVPAARLGNGRDRTLRRLAVAAAFLIPAGLLACDALSNVFPEGAVDLRKPTILHFLTHPVEFLRLLANTIAWRLPVLVQGLFGGSLSGLNLHAPLFAQAGFAALLCVAVRSARQTAPAGCGRRVRRAAAAGFALLTVGVVLTMYFAWTKIGDDHIHGLQARYWVPVLPLLVLLLARPLRKTGPATDLRAFFAAQIALHAAVLFRVLADSLRLACPGA